MSSHIYSREVLKVNSHWKPISFETPEKVFGDLPDFCRDRWTHEILKDEQGRPKPKLKALDIEFGTNPDGTPNFDAVEWIKPTDWAEWLQLPCRAYDLVVTTARQRIRIPRVVVTVGYDKMPENDPELNLDTVYELYGGQCAYTHRKLSKKEASMDHVHPRDLKGAHAFHNVVLSDKDFNCRKSNKTLDELGIPRPQIKIPKKLPMKDILKNTKNVPEWRIFLEA